VNDDYLWDRSGPPDEEIAALERLLSPLGQQPQPVPLRTDVLDALAVPRRSGPTVALYALAAAATVALAIVPLRARITALPGATSWSVVEIEGAASIASHSVTGNSVLSPGQSLRTGAHGRVALELGPIGHIEIGPSTDVRLVPAATGRYRFLLERGTLAAMIWADPGQFFVETRSSLAIDLGCAYTLDVDARGEGLLRVTTGWVGFQMRDRQALIPAGAICRTRPGAGPGTPYFEDAASALRSAVDVLDSPDTADAAVRDAALDRALAASRPRDAFTLWHLLQRVEGSQRDRVYDRLVQLVPPPGGVTRDGVRAGDRRMLELWWDRLGLGDTEWWHLMSRPWTDAGTR
jgi:hypothetical protein